MRRRIRITAVLLIAYLAIGSLLHFVVFPEPEPAAGDRPRRGAEVRLPGGSTFVYRVTAVESAGEVFEASWVGQPGAGIGRHTHPSQELRFRILEGTLRVVAGGDERLVGPGEEALIPAGVEHRWENASEGPARGVFELRPAGMADFVFVQMDRAFGGEAGAVSTALQTIILIGRHGRHTAWPIRTLRFVVAPTARLFGYRSYYEP